MHSGILVKELTSRGLLGLEASSSTLIMRRAIAAGVLGPLPMRRDDRGVGASSTTMVRPPPGYPPATRERAPLPEAAAHGVP